MKSKIKIMRFKYLIEKGVPQRVMFDIVKRMVIPSFHISFDEVVCYAIKSGAVRKQKYPLWEIYLNVLIRYYNIPVNTVENAVRRDFHKYKQALVEILKIISSH